MPQEQQPPTPSESVTSLTEFLNLSTIEQLQLFDTDNPNCLPITAQKLLIGLTAFGASARQDIAREVAELNKEEFEQAKQLLLKLGYINKPNSGRLSMDSTVKEFINGPLQQAWKEQNR